MSRIASLRATCWGTRGSIPSPGPTTARFGGNTSCLEVRSEDNRCFIFDGGSGIRVLGRKLSAEPEPTRAELFLTHFHWDHIQGIPFFSPLYDPRSEIRIHGARQGDVDIQTLFAGQMGPVYFPVPYEALEAQLEFAHLDGSPWRAGPVEISAFRLKHPAFTYGYRVKTDTCSLAYLPDNELASDRFPVPPTWYADLVEFLGEVDVLFHDAMFTDTEYASRLGWGHSTFRQAVELAEEAGVRRLYFFHHAPERSDADLLDLLDWYRDDLARRGSSLELGVAAEGEELLVQESET